MEVSGSVKDVETKAPIPGSQVSLYVGTEELAVIPSDEKGEFEHSVEASYIGRTLTCQVEKPGYKTEKITHDVKQEEVHLEIELEPIEKPIVRFSIKDAGGNPLEGVDISLEVAAERVGTGRSDKAGLSRITLRPDLVGKTLTYTAKRLWYKTETGQIQIEKETSAEITMKRIVIPLWTKIAAGITAAIVVVAIVIVFWPTTKKPDLIVESLTHAPERPTTQTEITFTAVVKNAGRRKADPSTLALKVGGETSPKTYQVPALEPGKTHDVERKEVLGRAQRYLITATADFREQIGEGNEANNHKTDECPVRPHVEAMLPDLIIESLTHTPANPTTLTAITFTAVVKNVGPKRADPSSMTLKVGGETSPRTYRVPALGPGQTHRVQRKEVLRAAQGYRNTATADSGNRIPEQNETNNQKTDDYQVGLPVVERLPDLTIESLTHTPANPTIRTEITFTATVKNAGFGTVGPSIVALKVGGETSPKTYQVPALRPGQTHRISRKEALGRAQRYLITATADFRNQINEGNETNNQKTDDCVVRPRVEAMLPDLYVSEFGLTPGTPVQGRPVKVRIGVYNKGTRQAGPFTVQWFGGENFPRPAHEWQLAGMVPNGGRILEYTYPGYESWYGRINTKVVIDPGNRVRETDKSNNVHLAPISVRKP